MSSAQFVLTNSKYDMQYDFNSNLKLTGHIQDTNIVHASAMQYHPVCPPSDLHSEWHSINGSTAHW